MSIRPDSPKFAWNSLLDASLNSLTRRRLVQLGAGGYLGLNLGGLWQAEAASATSSANDAILPASLKPLKACILVFYYGGPSHIDTYDLKPDAPAEVRGEFQPIATSVPGLSVCEHLPRMARQMHHVAQVRSVTHQGRLHDSASIHALTGRPLKVLIENCLLRSPRRIPAMAAASPICTAINPSTSRSRRCHSRSAMSMKSRARAVA